MKENHICGLMWQNSETQTVFTKQGTRLRDIRLISKLEVFTAHWQMIAILC